MIVRRQGDWLSAKVGDEIVMMSAEKGNYIGLNEVGARIWTLLETPRTVDEICAALMEEFEIDPAACRAETDAFLADLDKHGAVAFDQNAALAEPAPQAL